MLLLKKVLPSFMVAFTTASSMSAMPLSMKACTEQLGVRKSTVSFAYPLGTVIYMPASIASFTVVALTFASICQVEVNLSWVLRAIFTVTMLVIAMPPIPGAGLLVYTVLFAQLGIPSEAMVLATAIDVAVDYAMPEYRDCSVGRFLYSGLLEHGVKRLRYNGALSPQHEGYMLRMGFVRNGEEFVKEL